VHTYIRSASGVEAPQLTGVKALSRGSLLVGAAATNAAGGVSAELDDEDDAANAAGGVSAELDDEDEDAGTNTDASSGFDDEDDAGAGAMLDDDLELSNSSELTTRACIERSVLTVASLIVSLIGLVLDDIYSSFWLKNF